MMGTVCARGIFAVRALLVLLILTSALQLFMGCGGGKGAPATQALPTVAAAPQLSIYATTLGFGSVMVGQVSSPQSFTLTNSGDAALVISSLHLSDTADYTLQNNCGASLAASAGCTIALWFQPQFAASLPATLTIADNISGSAQTVTLAGTGTAIPVPLLSFTSRALAFPTTPTASTAPAQTIILQNIGSAPLAISSIHLDGTGAAAFADVTSCTGTLSASSTCTISVTFTPSTAPSNYVASLTVVDNTATPSQTIALTGVSIIPPAPLALLSSNSLSFASTQFGITTSTQSFTLTNPGNAPLSGIGISMSGSSSMSPFMHTTTCGTTLAVAGSCTVNVGFTPSTIGAVTGALSVIDNATGSPQTVTLSGFLSAPQATLSSASMMFPATPVGITTPGLYVTLTNSGNAPLNVTSVTVNGLQPLVFSEGTDCVKTLAPSMQCRINTSYTSFGLGANLATITVVDNASDSPQLIQLNTPNAIPQQKEVVNFGDSITCGYYANPGAAEGYLFSLLGYATLFDNAIGTPSQNLCRPGDQAAEMARLWVYPNTMPALNASQVYTVLIGTNDMYACGSGTGCVANWSESLSASLAWLALPATDKVLGKDITNTSGTWQGDLNIGLSTSQGGASLTFPVQQTVAGRSLYVAYRVFDPGTISAGTASLTVDGVPMTTLNASVTTGHTLSTQNGLTDTILVTSVPLGAVGQHTIGLTTTSADGNFFSLMWAGVSSGNYAATTGAPRVLVGGIPYVNCSSCDAARAVYNAQLSQIVSGFMSDGLALRLAPTENALDPATDMANFLHPNNSGHAKLAAAFESVY